MTTKPIPTIDTSQAVPITSIEQLNSLEPGTYLDPYKEIFYEISKEGGRICISAGACIGTGEDWYPMELDEMVNDGRTLMRLLYPSKQ